MRDTAVRRYARVDSVPPRFRWGREERLTGGPTEAAYVINDLVKPNAVIASHANEAGTVSGKVRAGSKTEAFVKATKVPVHVPLSGKTMEFDASGKCTAGC